MQMEQSAAYLTLASIATLGGAAIGVVAVTNTLRRLTGTTSLWVPFVASLVVVVLATVSAEMIRDPRWYLLTFLNTCLLFCTATGANNAGIQIAGRDEPGATPQRGETVPFFSSWTPKRKL